MPSSNYADKVPTVRSLGDAFDLQALKINICSARFKQIYFLQGLNKI